MKEEKRSGFTLLEVMVAVAIMAIALTAVLGSQSQSVSLAGEARFSTTAPLLAQSKMAQLQVENMDDLTDGEGDFGEEFPGYFWKMELHDVALESPEDVSDYLKRIDLEVFWGEDAVYRFRLRQYRFFPAGG